MAEEEKCEQVVQSSEEVQENEVVCNNNNGKKPNKFLSGIDNYFGITKSGSTFKTEILAGVTTFMAMAYILIVNPNILGATNPALSGAFYIATALGAIIGTLMMSLYAKHPFALAPGMGLNAFFAFTLVGVGATKMSVTNGLFIVLLSGILFLILTLVGVREKIVECIPKSVKAAIPAGIGLFIAFIGLQSSKTVVGNPSTLVDLQSFNFLTTPFAVMFPVLICFLALIIIAVLSKLKVKGAILWGILGGTVLYYVVGYCGAFVNTEAEIAKVATYYGLGEGATINDILAVNSAIVMPNWESMLQNPAQAFSSWGKDLVGQVFVDGWKFEGKDVAGTILVIITGVLSFAMVDMFDTIGTLIGTASKANMLDENGKLPRMGKALLSDSVATCAGAICGTTTVTTFVESSAGVAEGGRTGMTSLVTAGLFFVAMFLSPLAYIIPSCATSAALIYVGVLMISTIKDIDFSDVSVAVPAFLTISMMAFTYNISYGIGLGLISHCLIQLCTGKYFGIGKEFKGENAKAKTYYLQKEYITIIIAVVFILLFFLTH